MTVWTTFATIPKLTAFIDKAFILGLTEVTVLYSDFKNAAGMTD
jgi:hypothetical protein